MRLSELAMFYMLVLLAYSLEVLAVYFVWVLIR